MIESYLLEYFMAVYEEGTILKASEKLHVSQPSITKAIHNLSSEYTVLIIAHRLSTIRECHRIIVIDQGKIVGDGTHQELLKTNPYYKSLYQEELSQD